jgi:hypothetical protein
MLLVAAWLALAAPLKLTPYDMIPAKIGDAVLVEIAPFYNLQAIYQAPGGGRFQLVVSKHGSRDDSKCSASSDERIRLVKVGSHDACYRLRGPDFVDTHDLGWSFRDYGVRFSMKSNAGFEDGLQILTPRAEAAAAWLESFFIGAGPSKQTVEANRAAGASATEARRAKAKWMSTPPFTLDKLHKGALEVDPEQWYVLRDLR